MKTVLFLTLVLGASPARADAPPAEGTASGVSPYAMRDFETVMKAEQKAMEADYKGALSSLNASFSAQKELETRQFKERFAFLKKARDERADHEKDLLAKWKAFAAKLRAVEPAERGAERILYDLRSAEERSKFNEASAAKSKEFNDAQNLERDAFWAKQQKENEARARLNQERAAESGKTSGAR